MNCRVCEGALPPDTMTMHERMYSTREPFDYVMCEHCGCLQIADVPQDMSRFYPQESYYSLRPKTGLRQFSRRVVVYADSHYHRHWNFPKYAAGKIWGRIKATSPVMGWLRDGQVSKGSRILDVGCGSGVYLCDLRDEPFERLDGVDPFIGKTIYYSDRSTVYKSQLSECPEGYHFVMLNHSLEHMPDQHAIFRQLRRVTRRGGLLMIRVPLVDSAAWETFAENWVQLDAPRHLFLHSRKSLTQLAAQYDFTLEKTIDDSNSFAYWASEVYRRGQSPFQANTGMLMSWKTWFSGAEIARFENIAADNNKSGRGDQACFYFRG